MSPTKLSDIHKGGSVLSWATDLDEQTTAQALRTSRLPFVERPLALMADAHLGMGATIGSVIATKGAIIPSAVGVDIGCGMAAAPLSVRTEQIIDWDAVHDSISAAIPAGQPTKRDRNAGSHRNYHPDYGRMVAGTPLEADDATMERASRQFGTLGGGNHFVEACEDEEGYVWVVLHSGSRGVGNTIAKKHIAHAKDLMAAYFIELEDPDLAYLVEGTEPFKRYIWDMLWAQDFAAKSRLVMLKAAVQAVLDATPEGGVAGPTINCHHNYTEREHHHGKNLWVTRKGAIRAREGDAGIIPGSMATGSYIVQGTGCAPSYTSASHGAGRRMSRRQARDILSTQDLEDSMLGISWNDDPEGLLDESPGAYKDLDEVMENQKDLVTVTHRLQPLLNYKGA